ncbi:MAG: RidA family protein [Gemmatimonadaceae bacterium]|jgi:reactive intermediate/imine deaminase|nr:RidA family protein [Gemmatimonadaceae bacterium]
MMRERTTKAAVHLSHVPTGRRALTGRAALVVLALVALTGCARRSTAVAEYLTPYGPPQYPFSPAVRVGHTLYLAGQIGDANGALVPGGIEAETRQTLRNIADILEKSGSSLDRVVKCTVFMADMAEWPRMNAVYRTFFTKHLPARSAFGTTGLALGARVEIECLATVG